MREPHAGAPAPAGTAVAGAPGAERAAATAHAGSPATMETASPAVIATEAAVGARSQPATATSQATASATSPATATATAPVTATATSPATATATSPATATTPPPAAATTPAPATATATTPSPEAGASGTPAGTAGTERPAAPGRARAPRGGARQAPADPAGNATTVSKPAPTGADAGVPYTWRDGDLTRRARLQPHLVLQRSSANAKDDVVLHDDGRESIVERRARHAEGGPPVFRNEGGSLMTLPGGVLLVLDPGWDETRINRFFSANAIKPDRVTAQAFADNAFLVATEPGWASLELANALAEQDGVLIASPNWRSQITLR